MTNETLMEYVGSVGKSLNRESDFCNWIEFSHVDGSDFLINRCYFQLLREENIEFGWLIIWSKSHGVFVYNEKDIIEIESGEGNLEEEDNNESIVELSS